MNKNEKIILAITGFSHLLVHAVMLVLPAILLVLQKQFNVSISIGVTALDLRYFTSDINSISKKLLEQSDQALYDAKNSGRNCVMIFKNSNTNKTINHHQSSL